MAGTFPLELNDITQIFDDFIAVDELSMAIPQGSIVGFLGPNGAGKSTSLRIALGIISPTYGDAYLFGNRPTVEVMRNVGFLPEERGLYKKMTARSTIAYFGRLKGLKRGEAYRRADRLLDEMGLSEFASTRCSKLSKGMSQKVQIICTLVHQPDLLILDEPFSGLDPVNQQLLESLIAKEHKRGATIIFSTHVMEHAERLCDSIIMMARGRKVFDGSLEDAFDVLASRVRIAVKEGTDLVSLLSSTPFKPKKVESDDNLSWWRIALPEKIPPHEALKAAIENGVPIDGFASEEARLRDVFVKLTNDQAPTSIGEQE